MRKKTSKSMENDRVVLFVCTGNTCRSPMAEFIFRHYLKSVSKDAEYVVRSAGLAVGEMGINSMAQKALGELGIACDDFQSKQLDVDSLLQAYAVVCMERAHKDMIERVVGALDKVKTVGEITGEGDVPDPYGASFDVYVNTANKLMKMGEPLVRYLDSKANKKQPKSSQKRTKETKKPNNKKPNKKIEGEEK